MIVTSSCVTETTTHPLRNGSYISVQYGSYPGYRYVKNTFEIFEICYKFEICYEFKNGFAQVRVVSATVSRVNSDLSNIRRNAHPERRPESAVTAVPQKRIKVELVRETCTAAHRIAVTSINPDLAPGPRAESVTRVLNRGRSASWYSQHHERVLAARRAARATRAAFSILPPSGQNTIASNTPDNPLPDPPRRILTGYRNSSLRQTSVTETPY